MLLKDVPEDEFGVYDPKLFYEFPQWVQPDFGNFDNFFWGFLLLFEVAALEGWPDVMFWVIDSNQHMQFVEPSRLEMLQWMRAQVPPCPWDARTCEWAAKSGHLDLLKWARKEG